MDVRINLPCVEGLEFGSTGEAKAYLIENRDELRELVALASDIASVAFSNATVAPTDAPAEETATDDAAEPVKRRGRRSKAQIAADDAAAAAAAMANAPTPPSLPIVQIGGTMGTPLPTLPGTVTQTTEPPLPTMEALPNPSTLPTPPAPAPAPVPEAMKGTGTDGLELPGFLDRRGQPEPTPSNPTPPTTAPAPVAVTALPPPPAMPVLVLGPKVADKLLASKSGLTDGGAAWLNWLYGIGLIPDAEKTTFDEAIAVIRLTVDAAIKPVADHLGVTA